MNNIFKITLIISFGLLTVLKAGIANEEKIKIGLLVPITGNDKELGKLLIKSTRMALEDINNDKLEIYLKDTASDPKQTLKSAIELQRNDVKIVIGPVFHKSLAYLNDVEDMTFLSLTNTTENLPSNVISSGVNATSQLNSIKKFIELNEIKKTIFLIPNLNYDLEIKNGWNWVLGLIEMGIK